jgi:hypothetical protein
MPPPAPPYGEGLVERAHALAPSGIDLAFDTAGQRGVSELITLTGDPAPKRAAVSGWGLSCARFTVAPSAR